MQKVILFSPGGYIGGYLKEAILKDKDILLYEITRGSDLGKYQEDFDVMVYSASVSYASARKYVEDNVVTALTMVDFCLERHVKRIIYLSSDSVYGQLHTDMVSKQTVMVNPDLYGTTKYLAEKIIMQSDIPYYILRLPGVVGRVWRNNFISNLMLKIKRGEDITLYNMDRAFNNILYIDDLTRFVMLLCHCSGKKANEIFLLGNTESPKLEEIVLYMISLFSSKASVRNIEALENKYFTLNVTKAVEYGYSSQKVQTILDKLYQLQKEI